MHGDARRHALGPVGLHRIGLKVFAHNERAIACYAACGFVEEGREREAAYVGGAWRDDVIMGVLASDLARGVTGQLVLSDNGAHLSRERPRR